MEMSDKTYARYGEEAILAARQFVHETDRDDISDLSTEDKIVAACRWVLDQHDRWSKDHIRVKCVSMALQLEILLLCELISQPTGQLLLRSLQKQGPRPIGTSEQVNPNRRDQRARNGVIIRTKALRKLEKRLIKSNEDFARWIAGFLIIASRLGWRPTELLDIILVGRILSAPAEKYRRGGGEFREGPLGQAADRGLFECLEIRIGDRYPEKMLVALQSWIGQTAHWREIYGGNGPVIRERLRRACKVLRILQFTPYDLRDFAIASMKCSGRSRQEIAAVVNHLSDRTAGENYGKARSGARRPRGMFSVDHGRVAMVRKSAREYPKGKFDCNVKTKTPSS